MIKLLKDSYIVVDNGSYCGDGCCWDQWWESEVFLAGEEIDDDSSRYDISGLTEGEDYVTIKTYGSLD